MCVGLGGRGGLGVKVRLEAVYHIGGIYCVNVLFLGVVYRDPTAAEVTCFPHSSAPMKINELNPKQTQHF